ncbi:MAG: MBOAT family protein, partial [Ruthenibacterium sp.]
MVFSTVLFLFRFLPITLALYYLAPARLKNTVLFLCSLVFYSWGEVKLFPVMVVLILVNYLSGLCIKRFDNNPALRRLFLILSIVLSLGMLFFFKYTNFFIANINAVFGTAIGTLSLTLPLGISFYTFQTMSYSIDVYRREVDVEYNIINFGAYVVMFPQLIAGPIVKYRDVAERLHVLKGRVTFSRVDEGIAFLIFGL